MYQKDNLQTILSLLISFEKEPHLLTATAKETISCIMSEENPSKGSLRGRLVRKVSGFLGIGGKNKEGSENIQTHSPESMVIGSDPPASPTKLSVPLTSNQDQEEPKSSSNVISGAIISSKELNDAMAGIVISDDNPRGQCQSDTVGKHPKDNVSSVVFNE